MKKYIIILAIIFSIFSHSQIKKTIDKIFDASALQTGYANFGINYAYLGFDKRIDSQGDWIYVNVGAGSYISKFDDKLQFVPEIHTNYTAMILMGEISLTTKAINPSIGINLLNAAKLKIGYNYSYDSQDFRGTSFAININIGNKDYHHLPSMKFW